jgi:hypothetical protein
LSCRTSEKNYGLSPFSVSLRAFLAQGFSASALSQIFFFDVIAGVAVGVVVMHILLNAVPW